MTTATRDARNRETATSHPLRWAGLGVLSLSLLVVVMDMTILNVALPAIGRAMTPTSTEQLWIVDVYSLVLAGVLVTASAAGDRWGRRRMLMAGYTVFTLASAGVLLVDSPAQLIVLRALLGIGGGLIMPSTLSMIRVLFQDPKERATALGIWAATAAAGGAIGPIVGGLLLEHFSWQSAFLVNIPVMALGLVGAALWLPASRSTHPPRFDLIGMTQSMVGMVALVYAIKVIGKYGITWEAAGWAALALIGLGTFVHRCLSRPDPMLQLRLFRNRGMSAGVIAVLATTIAMAAALLLGAQWLQLVDGRSALGAGIALLPIAVGGLIASPLAPSLAGRIGARTVLAGGLAVGGLGFLLLFLAPDPLSYPWVAAGFGLVGLGMGPLAVASAVIMVGTPTEYAGSAAAIEETSYEVGAAFGVAILGSAAAGIYRGDLDPAQLTQLGLDDASVAVVRESISGAAQVAEAIGPAGVDVMARAGDAFTHAFTWTGLVGGGLMLAMTAVVYLLTPKDLDITHAQH